jgi:8-oxo-(d)GTP phosphatase
VAESARSRDVVLAAGGVLWREREGRVEVAVVHRPKYDDWSLPKGKLDDGEPAVAGGHREVLEETGFRAVVGRALGTSRYDVVVRERVLPKTVRWWAMRAVGGEFTPSREVDRMRWLPVASALEALTRPSEGEPLQRFADGPASTRTLLLLRHGSAGSRDAWDGDDDDRPLDALGRRQSDAARALLPLYGVERLVSAPPERCAASLRAAAEDLGVALELDERMAARGWSRDREATVDRLRELVRDGRPTAVCSQGEVLPPVIEALGTGSPRSPREPAAAKGSLWALSFDDEERLVDADYTEDLLG